MRYLTKMNSRSETLNKEDEKIHAYFERYLKSHNIDISTVSMRMAREIGRFVRAEYEKEKRFRVQKAIDKCRRLLITKEQYK
jgi:hypothetical protein